MTSQKCPIVIFVILSVHNLFLISKRKAIVTAQQRYEDSKALRKA
uniref:Uncharacterized protein n=1 Tax=Anguilla anguilla TaxID=7936 RepID=A0A0E9UHI3_ANGAN